MPSEGVKFLPCTQLPNLNRFVTTATNKGLPIRADGKGINPVGMPSEGAKFLPRTQLPNLNLFMSTTNKGLPIRVDGKTFNHRRVRILSEGTSN